MHRTSYEIVGLGGTFDHFHKGHVHFLKFAAQQAKHLRIGITDEKLTLHKKFSQLIQPYSERVKAVHNFCEKNGISHELFRLYDPYGPTLEKSKIQALIVTEATVSGAQAINKLRSKVRLRELPVHVCTLLKASSGEPLSSTLIREGKCTREGLVYTDFIKEDFNLTSEQKTFFSKPQGKIINRPIQPLSKVTCVVGDVCLNTFLSNNWQYQVGVYDNYTERKKEILPLISSLNANLQIENKAGTLSLQLIEVLKKISFDKKTNLFIDGEEDLVTVALALMLPLKSHIYYGQPNKGMVEILVTEQLKQKFWEVLNS